MRAGSEFVVFRTNLDSKSLIFLLQQNQTRKRLRRVWQWNAEDKIKSFDENNGTCIFVEAALLTVAPDVLIASGSSIPRASCAVILKIHLRLELEDLTHLYSALF